MGFSELLTRDFLSEILCLPMFRTRYGSALPLASHGFNPITCIRHDDYDDSIKLLLNYLTDPNDVDSNQDVDRFIGRDVCEVETVVLHSAKCAVETHFKRTHLQLFDLQIALKMCVVIVRPSSIVIIIFLP